MIGPSRPPCNDYRLVECYFRGPVAVRIRASSRPARPNSWPLRRRAGNALTWTSSMFLRTTVRRPSPDAETTRRLHSSGFAQAQEQIPQRLEHAEPFGGRGHTFPEYRAPSAAGAVALPSWLASRRGGRLAFRRAPSAGRFFTRACSARSAPMRRAVNPRNGRGRPIAGPSSSRANHAIDSIDQRRLPEQLGVRVGASGTPDFTPC